MPQKSFLEAASPEEKQLESRSWALRQLLGWLGLTCQGLQPMSVSLGAGDRNAFGIYLRVPCRVIVCLLLMFTSSSAAVQLLSTIIIARVPFRVKTEPGVWETFSSGNVPKSGNRLKEEKKQFSRETWTGLRFQKCCLPASGEQYLRKKLNIQHMPMPQCLHFATD